MKRTNISDLIKTVSHRYLVGERSNKETASEIEIGGQDIVDLISYAAAKEAPEYLEIDGSFMSTLFISGYPLVAHSGWLDSLIHFARDSDISYHLYAVPAVQALPKLRRKITELESTRRALIRAGRIVGPSITDPLESATNLRDTLSRGQEKLFQISITITLRAESLETLRQTRQLLESELAARLFFTRPALFRQLDGLQTTLPRGQDILHQVRNLDSSSAALTFPLVSSELVHPEGILYGINTTNSSLVILDRFSLHNANSITFAQSGSGKSYAMKVEILRQLMQKTAVFVIDPEREYEQLARSVSGSYIHLSVKSKQKINPFDLQVGQFKETELSEHVQDLTAIVSLMVGGLDRSEQAAVDKAILKLYESSPTVPPLLRDLHARLIVMKQFALAEKLDIYVTGSLSNVFNEQTNIDLGNHLIVFDIKDLSESLRPIMMMIIANVVQHQVKATLKKRLLVIDEAWLLLEHEQSARFVTGLVRRARKYYLGVAIISQQANDFLKNEYGRVIASQSSLRILMRQDSTTIANVVSQFQLSEFERKYLMNSAKGEAIIIADQNHVAVQVVASEREHPLITTDPSEILT